MFMDAFLYHQCFCTENHEKRVPLNIILQSKLLSKDEKIRKKGFCAETPRQGGNPLKGSVTPQKKEEAAITRLQPGSE